MVLKCRFYYSGVVRPTVQERIVAGKIVCYSRFPCRTVQGHVGKHHGWPEGRSGGEARAGACVVASVGKVRKGSVSRLQFA